MCRRSPTWNLDYTLTQFGVMSERLTALSITAGLVSGRRCYRSIYC